MCIMLKLSYFLLKHFYLAIGKNKTFRSVNNLANWKDRTANEGAAMRFVEYFEDNFLKQCK